LAGGGGAISALVYPADGLWAFVENDKENIYPLNASTGVLGTPLRLQEEDNAGLRQDFTAPHPIIAADATSDDVVYFLTSDGFKATLYRLELVTNSPTVAVVDEVGVLTVSGTTTTPDVGAFAIATLLDDERPEEEPATTPRHGRGSAPLPTPLDTSPEALAATGVTERGLAGVWLAGAALLVSGIALANSRRRARAWAGDG